MRECIAGLRRSVINLHTVSGPVPDKPVLLPDVAQGGEPARVSERLSTAGLQRRDRTGTHVFPLSECAVINGTLLLAERGAGKTLLAPLRTIRAWIRCQQQPKRCLSKQITHAPAAPSTRRC